MERQENMMYYIDKVNTWSPANRKWEELQDYVKEFRQTLIADDAAAEELVEGISRKVEELNGKYPRTKRLKMSRQGGFVSCAAAERSMMQESQYVFTFHIEKVRGVYGGHGKPSDGREKGGEA